MAAHSSIANGFRNTNGPTLDRSIAHCRALWRKGLRPGSLSALTFAIACVAIATIARLALGFISPDSAVFALFYSSTLVAALVGGAAAGVFASLLGGAVAYCVFVPPEWNSHPFMVEQLVSLVLYVTSSIIIVWAAESYRCLLARLREERNTRQLLSHELAHRIKNMLASVQAIISQSLQDQPEVRTKISARLAALAATNDLLVKSEWQGAALRDILMAEMAPYGESRFHLSGPHVDCPPALAMPLTLVFHELATNAAKYGALSTADGQVAVTWTSHVGKLQLGWIESGGPKPVPSERVGFGTKLLRSGANRFDWLVDMKYEPSGLHCRLMVTLPAWPNRTRPDSELSPQTQISVSLRDAA
jgi:two-component sensor histidine kinase